MAWGAPRGIDDLVARVRANDAALPSLCLLPTRRFNAADAAALCEALSANTVLTDLSISSHGVPPPLAALFAGVLHTNRTLASLSLGNSTFADEGLTALCVGLATNPTLRRLDLENKGLTAAGCVALGEALQGGVCCLQELILARNEIRPAGVAALAGPLPSLTSLDLRSCGLDSKEGGTAVAQLLSAAPLQILRLEDNALGEDGAAALAPALASAAALTELHLRGTQLGVAGAAALATHLPPALVHLDFSDSGAGSEALRHLGASLAGGAAPELRRLTLCNAGGDDAALAELVQALSGPSRPVGGLLLDLSGNHGGQAALQALAQCPSLRSLCLHDCKLGQHAAALSTLAASGGFASLQELDLSANSIAPEALLALLGVLGADQAACAQLRQLVIAANPGLEGEAFEGAMERVQGARPLLSIVRTVADAGEKGKLLGGAQ